MKITISCILLKFYIKPQLSIGSKGRPVVVSYWNSTSNHNSGSCKAGLLAVVSYWNSTSNHNIRRRCYAPALLYLIEILHQTTTLILELQLLSLLYLIEILHQTTTFYVSKLHTIRLYLIEILHQTTTVDDDVGRTLCCILLKFYIKPQHIAHELWDSRVVSYWNSTSNHNAV